MPDSPRRLLLRVSVKLMLLFAFGSSLYILFAGIGNQTTQVSDTTHQPLRFELGRLTADTPQRLVWERGNLIIIRRNTALLESLHELDSRLQDPYSRSSNQPSGLSTPERALLPEFFIAFDRGTDMGCPLSWIPRGDRTAPLQPWPGGFRDSCRGSWYDASGRVFRNQEAKRNLDIPKYRLIGEDLLEVGGSGDNAGPAK